jgi:acyl carrier protein
MTRESVVESIKEILSGVLLIPISEIDSRKGLTQYNIDSLDMILFVEGLEDEFEIDIDPSDFLGASSIERLADEIFKKTGKQTGDTT